MGESYECFFVGFNYSRLWQNCYNKIKRVRTRLVQCNDYYIGTGISITRNTLNLNVISITIY